MRLKHIKGSSEKIEKSEFVIKNPTEYKGVWHKLFNNNNPIYIEIGMGKGDFIYEMARLNPDINFIGIEKYSNVLARAIKKYPDGLPNLKIINLDALKLEEVFSSEITTIYLNFSDPWPKERTKNRRLTSEVFLRIYDSLFQGVPHIVMKTDNLGLFASSLVSLSNYGYSFSNVNLDLHHSDIPNVLTEYEKKFQELGVKINYLDARK